MEDNLCEIMNSFGLMNKAVFLDRDGIIIRERGDYNYLHTDLEMVPGLVEALGELKKHGYIFIVITNQGGIARGLYTHSTVEYFHEHIKDHLAKGGIKIKDFFYCPHHPEIGNCLCRKPDS